MPSLAPKALLQARARLLVALGLPLRFDIPLFLRGNAGSIPAGRAN
jgi:hypothetical protein